MLEAGMTNQHLNPEFNKLYPEEDRLSKMRRDFRFHPATTTAPQALTREQIEAFNRGRTGLERKRRAGQRPRSFRPLGESAQAGK